MMTSHIEKIHLEESTFSHRDDSFVQNRERVIADIIHENHFRVLNHKGPYHVYLGFSENRLKIEIWNTEAQALEEIMVPLSRLRSHLKDYHIVCESYVQAVNSAEPHRVEAIDMGRRGLHDEGALLLQSILERWAETDNETARKLFSLVYFLQLK
jgi:uncharacterized protein (UPF0262 family)